MRALLNMMRLDANWASMFNYVSNGQFDVAQAILVLQQSKDGKPREGYGLALFNRPFMGCGLQTVSKEDEGYMTLSKDEILERVVELVMGFDDYKALRDIGTYLESGSIRETLSHMINAQAIVNMDESDREELPGYGEFHDFGRMIKYGQKYVRKPRRTPDSLANSQQTIKFDETDQARALEESHDGRDLGDIIDEEIGSRPFGYES